MLAVTFGPIVQIDGPNPKKRAVLPLHPELLQATLLQALKQIEEKVRSTLLDLNNKGRHSILARYTLP